MAMELLLTCTPVNEIGVKPTWCSCCVFAFWPDASCLPIFGALQSCILSEYGLLNEERIPTNFLGPLLTNGSTWRYNNIASKHGHIGCQHAKGKQIVRLRKHHVPFMKKALNNSKTLSLYNSDFYISYWTSSHKPNWNEYLHTASLSSVPRSLVL